VTAARERGWALVSVLWALSVLAVLAAASQTLSFSSARQERFAFDAARSDALLEAAVTEAMLGVSDTRVEKRWRTDGTAKNIVFAGATMKVAVQDENGRIDLNAADVSLFTRLFQSVGVAKEEAVGLADHIVDWRSRDNANGTVDEYARAGLSYHPRHGAFQSVDELALVLGMTPSLMKQVRPALTVYSRHPAVDTAVAPPQVLKAYFLDDPDRVADILSARSERSSDGAERLAANVQAGRAYEVSMEAAANEHGVRREAVVVLTGDIDRPYLTLSWR
jgi:general secretion pathway protein K